MTIKIVNEQPNTTKGKYYENARYNELLNSYIVKGNNYELVSVLANDCEVVQDEPFFVRAKKLIDYFNNTGEMFDVHKDKHYKKKVEPIDLIEAFDLNFELGNVIKYVARCNHKGSKQEDLRKAMYYLKREMYKK